jgi:hypothetical protein
MKRDQEYPHIQPASSRAGFEAYMMIATAKKANSGTIPLTTMLHAEEGLRGIREQGKGAGLSVCWVAGS